MPEGGNGPVPRAGDDDSVGVGGDDDKEGPFGQTPYQILATGQCPRSPHLQFGVDDDDDVDGDRELMMPRVETKKYQLITKSGKRVLFW